MADVSENVVEDDHEAEPPPEDHDLGGLISFANLENVVKHIIRKFKSIEQHNEYTEERMGDLQASIDQRATISSMDEMQAEVDSRFTHLKMLNASSKESITSLETALERSRVVASALEKKLEAAVKEKAVQDRLIRETQEALQDKVAIAELHMFEAKFAGYTTKLELQEVMNTVNQCARVEHAERISESVRVLGTQFDDYTRTAKIDQQLQELRDWVSDELQNYARLRTTNDRLEDLQQRIQDQSLTFERANYVLDDKLRSLADREASMYAELSADLNQRALAEDLKNVGQSLAKYALKKDTDAFEQDTLPKLRFCVDSIKDFDQCLRTQSEEIQHVDEVLLDKAGKYEIVALNARVDECYKINQCEADFAKMYRAIERNKKEFDEYTLGEAERLEQVRPPDYGPIIDKLELDTKLKADRADLVEMYQLKANRIDTDELAKLQDTIHKQLEYLSVTTVGLSKLCLSEAKLGESKTVREQQKAQVLMQSEALWHWILHNHPPQNLDTLRAPPGRRVSVKSGDGAAANTEEDAAQARRAEDAKRAYLEKRLGI